MEAVLVVTVAEWTGLEPIPLKALFSIFYKFANVAIPEFPTKNLQQLDS